MTIYIPFPDGYTPPDPPDYTPGEVGLEVQRELTHLFIQQDPTQVRLIPRDKVSSGNGGSTLQDSPPRSQQVVKLISVAANPDGISNGQAGQDRQYDYVMVMEWNGSVATNDYWVDDITEQKYVVTGVSPYNGYEVKATVKSFGSKPIYG